MGRALREDHHGRASRRAPQGRQGIRADEKQKAEDRLYSVDGFDAPVTVRLTGEYPLDLNDDFLQVRYERQIFEDDARVFSELAGDDYFFTTLHYVGWCRNGELTCEYMDDNQFEILMPTNDSDMSFEDALAEDDPYYTPPSVFDGNVDDYAFISIAELG